MKVTLASKTTSTEDKVSYTEVVKQLKKLANDRMDQTLTTAKLPSGALELFGLYHDPDLDSTKELLKDIVLCIDKKATLRNIPNGKRIVFTCGGQIFTITVIVDEVEVPKYGILKVLRYRLMAA